MNNHMMLLDNNTVLLDIQRNVLAGQGGTDHRNQPVSVICYHALNKKY